MVLDNPVSLLVWTTTPWTIPANKAVCVSSEAKSATRWEQTELVCSFDVYLYRRYCVVDCECPGGSRELVIVAVNRLGDLRPALKQELPVVATFSGKFWLWFVTLVLCSLTVLLLRACSWVSEIPPSSAVWFPLPCSTGITCYYGNRYRFGSHSSSTWAGRSCNW